MFIIAIKIRFNAIGPAGAQALATALTGNSTMTELGFSCVIKYISFFFVGKLFDLIVLTFVSYRNSNQVQCDRPRGRSGAGVSADRQQHHDGALLFVRFKKKRCKKILFDSIFQSIILTFVSCRNFNQGQRDWWRGRSGVLFFVDWQQHHDESLLDVCFFYVFFFICVLSNVFLPLNFSIYRIIRGNAISNVGALALAKALAGNSSIKKRLLGCVFQMCCIFVWFYVRLSVYLMHPPSHTPSFFS